MNGRRKGVRGRDIPNARAHGGLPGSQHESCALAAPISESLKHRWQFVDTEPERLQAERKLDGWLVKPTDGIFARFNRRISIPISRELIRFPITPNMVSLFTLGVSFLSGLD